MSNQSLSKPPSSLYYLVLARTLFIHLRLNFQILLAPIFLWGYVLAGGQPNTRFWLAFVILHVCLYGGTTAYNSYYDRDEGPVGGLEKPPPILPELWTFSLILQAVGGTLAIFVNLPFLLIYLTIFTLATAYSHPRTRLKGRPFIGLLTVALGQGILAALSGWITAQPNLQTLGWTEGAGLLAAAMLTTGFYPITQIYQVDEDLARGDKTFAVWAGPRRTFAFALLTMSLAAAILLYIFCQIFGLTQTLLLALFCTGLLIFITYWAFTYDASQVLANFRRVMRLYTLMTLGFLGFLGLHLFGFL